MVAVTVGFRELHEEGLVLGGAAGSVHGDGEGQQLHHSLQELGVQKLAVLHLGEAVFNIAQVATQLLMHNVIVNYSVFCLLVPPSISQLPKKVWNWCLQKLGNNFPCVNSWT